ncbi:MAG: peptidase [Anaerolineaceae bacterium]|nr:peptidase [Anaerolineaceae bacterium]
MSTPQPIFDGHNDTLLSIHLDHQDGGALFLNGPTPGHIDLPRARAGGLIGGLYAIYPPAPKDSPESAARFGLKITENGYVTQLKSAVDPDYARVLTDDVITTLHELERNGDGQVQIVRSYDDLVHNLENDVHSIVLHFEDAAAIKADLSNLDAYYANGLRSIGLVWSRPNAFGCGVPFEFPNSPDIGPGLTDAGKALVQACNRLGILIDMAHLNEKGFWDVAEISDAPLVVSHTGVHAICPSTRDLTDAQIDAVGQSNGLIGIMFSPSQLRPDGNPEADVELSVLVDHIEYVANRIGIDHIALGSDFDGAKMPQALSDAAMLPNLIHTLEDRGYGPEPIEKIAYRNWFRVLKETWHAG